MVLLSRSPADARSVSSRTVNPMWDLVRTLEGGLSGSFGADGRWSPQMSPFLSRVRDWAADTTGREFCLGELTATSRDAVVRRYAWAIADPDTVDFVARHATDIAHRGVLEVGAGTGYWAGQLAQSGVDVLAFDHFPPHLTLNFYHHRLGYDLSAAGQEAQDVAAASPLSAAEIFFEVRAGTADQVAADHPDRTLLISWPPFDTTMAQEALSAYRGNRLVYLGEVGGACANDAFFAQLDAQWTLVADHQGVTWDMIHDRAQVYVRS